MPKVLMHLLAVCLSGTALALVERAPAEAYDMYYLSVGNSHYQDTTLDIPDADRSADEIGQTLRIAGAVDGLTLTSKEGAYVTRDEVLGALSQIASKAKAARNPLVVYYFLGHGMWGEDRDDLSHVSLLGHYEPSDPLNVTRSSSIIKTEEIMDLLDEQDLRYILILDNCYDREPASPPEEIARTLTNILTDTIKELHPARMLTHPVIILYAAEPGHSVQMLDHPENKDMASGPLARRLLLLLKATFESQKELTVGNFLQQMNDPTFDPESVPGHHKAWIRDSGSTVLIPAGARSKSAESDR